MGTLRRKRSKRAGFSLIEAMMSTFIFLSVLGALYGTISSGHSFVGVQDTLAKMQMDARKTLEHLTDELRMSGWRENPVVLEPDYPYIFVNGVAHGSFADESHPAPAQHVAPGNPAFGDVKEIVFKIPVDLDGNGLLTDDVTGDVEWSPWDVSYVLITSPGGVNELVRREDGVVTDILARYVERITFDNIFTDGSVRMNEITITIYMARPTPKGAWLQTTMSTIVTMRNVEDVS